MAGPICDSVHSFVEAVFSNETLLQSERKQLILSTMVLLAERLDGTHRWGMSMTLGNFAKEASRLRKKNRSEQDT